VSGFRCRALWLLVAALLLAPSANAETLLKTELDGVDGYNLMVYS